MNHRWKTPGRFLALAGMLGAMGAASFAQTASTSLGAHQREFILRLPGQGVYRAVVNGALAQVHQPRGLLDRPMPGGVEDFCDLLPQASLLADLASGQAQSTAAGAVAGLAATAERVHIVRTNATRAGARGAAMDIDLDAATGLPLRIVHTSHSGHRITVTYSHYQQSGGIEHPPTLKSRWTANCVLCWM